MRFTIPSPATAVSCVALLISLVVGAHPADTVFSTDIVDGEVKQADLATNAVTSVKVYPNALLLADIAGADIRGNVSIAPIIAGRCKQVDLGVSGAKAGDVPVIATQGSVQNGVFFYAMRTPTDGHVTVSVCNMSGTTMTAISNLPVRVVTFR